MLKPMATILPFLIACSLFAQNKGKKVGATVAWMSPQEAENRLNDQKKPLLIDVYTDWCHYCKVMDNTTWTNQNVAAYLEKYFYPIKFNAENKGPVSWMGKMYEYKPTYKVHMLAAEWLQGNMVYPSTVLIPPEGGPVVIPGVLKVKEIEPILKYFGEKHYLTTEWDAFKKNYHPGWN